MSTAFSVFCDFDGTITQVDTLDYLLERLADPSWKDIEARWMEGEIGSRECLSRQIPLIQGGWSAIYEALKDVKLDPTFAAFAVWCRQNKLPLIIVSEGVKPIIEALFARENIQVDAIWANDMVQNADGSLAMKFPFPPDQILQQKNCQAGLCKCQVIDSAPADSFRIVIGDGQSDLCWATEATHLFAKAKLLQHCQYQQIPCTPFENFVTVQQTIEALMQEKGVPNESAVLA